MSSEKKKRHYAFAFMIIAEALALILFLSGCILRETVVKDMPQYDDVQTIALPMLVAKEWDAIQEEKKIAAENAAKQKEREKAAAKRKAKRKAEREARKNIDEHYFDHTLFIGDSRTEELSLWGRLGKARYFCGVSYSVFNIFSKKVDNDDFHGATLKKALAEREYDQVYIMLGYNESGYPYDSLMKQYTEVLDYVQDAQPTARIVLHGIMHASRKAAKATPAYAPKHLEKINKGIRKLAEKRDDVYYVDCNGPFCDEDGYLKEDVSNDGEHLDVKNTEKWRDEILKQAVIPELS